MMNLDELFDHGAKFSKIAFERVGEIRPMWICISTDGELVPIMAPMPENKDALAAALRIFFKGRNITRYVSILECWMLTVKKSKEEIPQDILQGKSRVADHPDRVEAIMISAEDANGKNKSGFYLIHRDGDKAWLSPLEINAEAEMMAGRFVDLLTPETRN